MSEDQRKKKSQVYDFILRHLIENPNAGDTLEGIVGYWVPHQRIRAEALMVVQALAELIKDGLVVQQQGPDSRVIYRANLNSENLKAKLDELRGESDEDE